MSEMTSWREWTLDLDALCMTYWGETAGVVEPHLLRHYWGLGMTPNQAFEAITRRYELPVELPEGEFEYKKMPEPATPGSSIGHTLRETNAQVCETIITSPRALSQAVKNFRKTYPHHAADKPRLQTARELVKTGAIRRMDLSPVGFDVVIGSRRILVAEKKCGCERGLKNRLCEHRIAVCLAVAADEIDRAKRIAAHEHHAVLNEEQDPQDDAHAQHGTWIAPTIHQCADGEMQAVAPAEVGSPVVCSRCNQPYCAMCDREAQQ